MYIYICTYKCGIGPKISTSPGIKLSDAKALMLKLYSYSKKIHNYNGDKNAKQFSHKMQMSDQIPPPPLCFLVPTKVFLESTLHHPSGSN